MPAGHGHKTWKDSYRGLIIDHGIRFEGPKQFNDWPLEHRHHFLDIHEIWNTRYAKYVKSKKLSKKEVHNRRRTAQRISRISHTFRHDLVNEDTWRGIEGEIMRVFENNAVCGICKNELNMFEHEAEPFDANEVIKLRRKRKLRVPCTCHSDNASVASENGDIEEAQPIIFLPLISHTMEHHPVDKLEEISVPMAPDRAIGLKASPQMQLALRVSSSELDHCPMKGSNQVLYPFLLIEAKREINTPGFVAIEAQTAFPLRRILLLQDDLSRTSKITLHALAWFFAYRGEEWRLYAGTLEDRTIHVWDLWHGTVESLDGSLQLLQIVDYLWTWARDIYRPQIRRCLCALIPSLRDMTPSTSPSLSRSQSVLSELRSMPVRASQADVISNIILSAENGISEHTTVASENIGGRLISYGPHRHDSQENCVSQTIIKHSNLVVFSFTSAQFPATDHATSQIRAERQKAGELLDFLLQSGAIAILKSDQVSNVQRMWTGELPAGGEEAAMRMMNTTAGSEQKAVFFWCCSFCSKQDWQITRQLYCLTWSLSDIQQLDSPLRRKLATALREDLKLDHYDCLMTRLSAIRRISGPRSISCALNETKLSLAGFSLSDTFHSLVWTDGPFINQVRFDQRFPVVHWLHLYRRYTSATLGTVEIDAMNEALTAEGVALIPIAKDMGRNGGILAKKPQSWPLQCPKFCLFVLANFEASDRGQVSQLLQDVVKNREFYGAVDEHSQHQDLSIDQEDRNLIRRWQKLLKR